MRARSKAKRQSQNQATKVTSAINIFPEKMSGEKRFILSFFLDDLQKNTNSNLDTIAVYVFSTDSKPMEYFCDQGDLHIYSYWFNYTEHKSCCHG